MEQRYKYPRTSHLPWSPGATSDDKIIQSLDALKDQWVVVTEKMDGENTTLYRDGLHARSLDGKSHPSRDWLKADWASKSWDLPARFRICGENLYARHSIAYKNLKSYFYGFSYWEGDFCHNWEVTERVMEYFGYPTPEVIFEGKFDLKTMEKLHESLDPVKHEGYVVRVETGFHVYNFNHVVAKWVRPNHVQTDDHWMHKEIVQNDLLD